MSLKIESVGAAATAVVVAVGAVFAQPIVLLVAAGAAIFLTALRISDPERAALKRLNTAAPLANAPKREREMASTVSR